MANANDPKERIPLFFGNEKDAMTPVMWIAKVERLQVANGWTPAVTLNSAANALRETCEEWYSNRMENDPSLSWSYFRTEFLDYTGGNITSFKGFTYWQKMITRRGDLPLNKYFNTIDTANQHWAGTIPTRPTPDNWTSTFPANVQANPQFQALPQAIITAMVETIRRQTQRDFQEHQLMGLFYYGLHDTTKDHLLAQNHTTVKEMKMAVLKFEVNRKDSNRPIHAVDEVSAINQRNKRQGKKDPKRMSTQPQRNPDSKKNVQCHYCKKMNHFQIDCHKRARDKAPMVRPSKVHGVDEEDPPKDNVSLFESNPNHLNYE